MTVWKALRNPILALTFSGTVLVLGKIVLLPFPTEQQREPYVFPTDVSLAGWQPLEHEALTDPVGQTYSYKQGAYQLDIEMRYVDHPHANEKLFRQYDPALMMTQESGATMRQGDAIGFYSLSVEDGRAFLRSCINPRGEGTITYEQFIKNRYTADLHPSRFLPWLMGQEPLRDHRCLWAHLSIPSTDSSPNTAYQILESTWPTWYEWWQSHFPEL